MWKVPKMSNISYERNEYIIYVTNLPPDIRTEDIQDIFYRFGKITFVDLKNRRGPPFAFMHKMLFMLEMDMTTMDIYMHIYLYIRVEFTRGGEPEGFRGSNRGSGGGGGRGLPPSGSWQDLKDHMRKAGDVCFANVFKDGIGVVEFLRYLDMEYAGENTLSYIRVKEDYGGEGSGGRGSG
ncbi:Serine/arginine-rich splicing factor 1 [Blattella germanica]|nr:Serine/arginine-rich splicing factor 1 [Blattella germanica]